MPNEEVLQDFGMAEGRFRIRLIKGARGVALDIREYMEKENYVGFTRRGIRIYTREGLASIMNACKANATVLPAAPKAGAKAKEDES